MTGRDALARAHRVLERGGLVVYPTDTLLGLGARATDRSAVRRLFEEKGRPVSRALSFAVSSYEEIEPWAELTPRGRREIRSRLPGPFTLILKASQGATRGLAPGLIGPGRTVALRIPDHPVARELARRAGPIVATSANPHGEPPARTIAEARRWFGDRVGAYLGARPRPSGHASEIVDLTGEAPRPVRRGTS